MSLQDETPEAVDPTIPGEGKALPASLVGAPPPPVDPFETLRSVTSSRDFVERLQPLRPETTKHRLAAIKAFSIHPTSTSLLPLLLWLREHKEYGYNGDGFLGSDPVGIPHSPEGAFLKALFAPPTRRLRASRLVEYLQGTGPLAEALTSVVCPVDLVNGDVFASLTSSAVSAHVGDLSRPVSGFIQSRAFSDTSGLVGLEVDQDDLNEMRALCDWCVSGTLSFLNNIGVDAYEEGGEAECDSCGSTVDCDEPLTAVIHSGRFEITEERLEALERESNSHRALEYLRETYQVPTARWSDLLEDPTMPWETPASEGVALAPGYRFEVDLERALDGDGETLSEALEGEELVLASMRLARALGRYETAGQVPPIPGRLVYVQEWSPETRTWTWDGIGNVILRDASSAVASMTFPASPNLPPLFTFNGRSTAIVAGNLKLPANDTREEVTLAFLFPA